LSRRSAQQLLEELVHAPLDFIEMPAEEVIGSRCRASKIQVTTVALRLMRSN